MGATHGIAPPLKWTEERKAELAELTRKRFSLTAAAAAMGIAPVQVKGARQRFKLKTGGNKGMRWIWSDETLRAISDEMKGRTDREAWKVVAARYNKKPDAIRMAVGRWRAEQRANVS
jgi:hypothetical protein